MINIRLADLKNLVDEFIEDGVDFLEVFIMESEVFEGEHVPATLQFISYDGFGGGCEYDHLEGIEVDVFYKLTH